MSKELNFSFTIPDNWEEVPAHRLAALAAIYLKTDEQMPMIDRQVRAFVLLAGSENWKYIKKLSDEQLYDLLPSVDWVFDQADLLSCKLPFINSRKTKLLAPDDNMGNLRFAEFIFVDQLFREYAINRDDAVLNKFVACLYRPKGEGNKHDPKHVDFCGDQREKFNSNIIDQRAKRLQDVDINRKLFVFFWYFCCMQNIRKHHPDVFPNQKKNSKPNPSEPDYGWIGVFDEIRGEKGRTGDDLEEEFLSMVLLSLQRNAVKFKNLSKKK